MIRKLLIPALALAAFGTTAAQAGEQAQRAGDGIVIRTADLDLTKPEGVRRLQRRINAAAETLCGSSAGASWSATDAIDRCYEEVRLSVAPQLARVLRSPRFASSRAR